MPAPDTPMASATTITPSGIASMAERVEIGLLQLSGVARSSRAGTNRRVKAGPISRSPPGTRGLGPFIQQRLMPFLSSMVLMVAVVTLRRTSNTAEFIADLVVGNYPAQYGAHPDPRAIAFDRGLAYHLSPPAGRGRIAHFARSG